MKFLYTQYLVHAANLLLNDAIEFEDVEPF